MNIPALKASKSTREPSAKENFDGESNTSPKETIEVKSKSHPKLSPSIKEKKAQNPSKLPKRSQRLYNSERD